jgi:hypothetical protein
MAGRADVDAGALDRLQLGRSSSQNPLRLSRSGCGPLLVLLRQDPARLQGLPVRVQRVEAELTCPVVRSTIVPYLSQIKFKLP